MEQQENKPSFSFASKIFWYTTGYILRSFTAAFSMYVITHFLKLKDYGKYSQVLAVAVMLGLIGRFGMPGRIGAWMIRYPKGKDRAGTLWAAIITSWIIGTACLLIGVPLLMKFYHWFDRDLAAILLIFTSVKEVLGGSVALLEEQFDWDENIRARIFLSLAISAVPALAGCTLVLIYKGNIVAYAVGIASGMLIVAVTLFTYIRRYYRFILNSPRIREALKTGWVFLALAFSYSALYSIGLLLLAHFRGEEATALYNFGNGISVLISGTITASGGMFIRHVFRGGITSHEQLKRPFIFSITLPPLYALFTVTFIGVIFRVFVGESYHASYEYIAALVAIYCLFYLSNVGIALYYERQDIIFPLIARVSGLLLVFPLNLLLIPRFGIWGSIIAFALSTIWIIGLMLFKQGILQDMKELLLKGLAFWIICAIPICWITLFYPPSQWVMGMAVGIPSSLIVTFIYIRLYIGSTVSKIFRGRFQDIIRTFSAASP